MYLDSDSIDVSHDEGEILNILKHDFSKQQINTEQHVIIPEKLGTGSIRRIKVEKDLEIIISDMELSEDLTIYVEDDCHYFEMNYLLSGHTICEMNSHQIKMLEPRSHAYFSNDTKLQLDIKSNIRNQMVEIRMSPTRLLSYFDHDKEKVSKILESKKGQLTSSSLSPLIKKCVLDILECAYHGAVKKIYYEAKIMELITLFFQEQSFYREKPKHFLEPINIKKLQNARDIILNNLANPFTIKQLAKEVGLNEFQLKKEFKQLYGKTIFGLIRSEKMEKAAWLMTVKGFNVSETASIIGYSNFSNFTVAFRKHFGCNPSDYLKEMLDKKY